MVVATHRWASSFSPINDTQHGKKCTVSGCNEYSSILNHAAVKESDKATCTKKARCTQCSINFGDTLPHTPVGMGSYTIINDEKHIAKCKNCSTYIERQEVIMSMIEHINVNTVDLS